MLLDPWTYYEKQKYWNESRFNVVYSRNNLPNIKGRAYKVNLDECKSIGTHLIALYMSNNNVTYFYSFWVEYVPKEIEKFVVTKNIKTNI